MGCGGSSPAAETPTSSDDVAVTEGVKKDVVITGTLVAPPPADHVPQRTKRFFHQLDRDKDNKVTLDELQTGFEAEFKGTLAAHAKEAIVSLFEAHAVTEGWTSGKFLKPGSFNRFYAEILFRHFDANNNGYLELAEAQEALKFLVKKKEDGEKPDVNAVFPASAYTEAGELKLPKAWFFQMYKAME